MKQCFLPGRPVSAFVVVLWLAAGGCTDSGPRPEPTDAVPLASLAIAPALELEPAFSSRTTDYAASVSSEVTSVAVTAVPEDRAATIAINGMITPGGAQQSVALLQPGTPTPVEVVASAPDGRATTYTIIVSRLASKEAKLAALNVSAGSLKPPFDPDVGNYTVDVGHLTDSVVLKATKMDSNATLSGAVTAQAGASVGETPIPLGVAGTAAFATLTVTAPSGAFKIYSVIVNRSLPDGTVLPPGNGPPSTVSTATLTGSPSALYPVANATNTYSTIVYFDQQEAITVTKTDPNAVIRMGNQVLAPAGVPSVKVVVGAEFGGGGRRFLNFGGVQREFTVTAQDQVTSTKYTVDVDFTFRR